MPFLLFPFFILPIAYLLFPVLSFSSLPFSSLPYFHRYCTESNLTYLEEMRNDLVSIQLPLAVLSFITFYYGNNLYKSDDKVEIDPFPNNPLPDMPALVVAHTSTIAMIPLQPSSAPSTTASFDGARDSGGALQPMSLDLATPSGGGGGDSSSKSFDDSYASTYAYLPFAGEAVAASSLPSASATTTASFALQPSFAQPPTPPVQQQQQLMSTNQAALHRNTSSL